MSKFLIVIGGILQVTFIAVEHRKKYVFASILKGLAALCFVLLGILASDWNSYSTLIVIGLICGMVGDIFLSIRYIFRRVSQKLHLIGIAAFMMGHIAYLSALMRVSGIKIQPVLIGFFAATILCIWIFGKVKVDRTFRVFGIIYICAVTFMAVYGIWNAWLIPVLGRCLFACGGVLFLLSDIGLVFNTFTGKTRFPLRVMNLSLYYIGQMLIAGSLMVSRAM